MRARTSGHCQRCPEQLEQVVRGGHQCPFPVHLLLPPQPEPIQQPGAFDLAQHWFDDRLAQGVDRLTGLGSALPLHSAASIRVTRGPTRDGRGRWPCCWRLVEM
jgi:hypothetical protein